MTSAEPLRGAVPRTMSSLALDRPGPGGRMDPAVQWADRSLTMLTELAVDEDGRLYGHPRGSVGFTREITPEWFAAWVGAEHPAWQAVGMTPADWKRVVDALIDRVRARDAAAVIAVPADARRAAELAASRIRDTRRAELQRQAAEAQAELAAYADAPAEVEPARRGGGWMRRPAAP